MKTQSGEWEAAKDNEDNQVLTVSYQLLDAKANSFGGSIFQKS